MGKVKVTELKKGQTVKVTSDTGPVEGEVDEVEQRERAGEQIVLVTINTANGGFMRPMFSPDDEIELAD